VAVSVIRMQHIPQEEAQRSILPRRFLFFVLFYEGTKRSGHMNVTL